MIFITGHNVLQINVLKMFNCVQLVYGSCWEIYIQNDFTEMH